MIFLYLFSFENLLWHLILEKMLLKSTDHIEIYRLYNSLMIGLLLSALWHFIALLVLHLGHLVEVFTILSWEEWLIVTLSELIWILILIHLLIHSLRVIIRRDTSMDHVYLRTQRSLMIYLSLLLLIHSLVIRVTLIKDPCLWINWSLVEFLLLLIILRLLLLLW